VISSAACRNNQQPERLKCVIEERHALIRDRYP
jgi:hypothetical protein